jgi:hypothetical protein
MRNPPPPIFKRADESVVRIRLHVRGKETMKKARKRTSSRKKDGMLISVAESIGSTLGTIAAKTAAAQKTLGLNGTSKKRRSGNA